jgi:hypothetical protein
MRPPARSTPVPSRTRRSARRPTAITQVGSPRRAVTATKTATQTRFTSTAATTLTSRRPHRRRHAQHRGETAKHADPAPDRHRAEAQHPAHSPGGVTRGPVQPFDPVDDRWPANIAGQPDRRRRNPHPPIPLATHAHHALHRSAPAPVPRTDASHAVRTKHDSRTTVIRSPAQRTVVGATEQVVDLADSGGTQRATPGPGNWMPAVVPASQQVSVEVVEHLGGTAVRRRSPSNGSTCLPTVHRYECWVISLACTRVR